MKTASCYVTKKELPMEDLVPYYMIKHQILFLIKKDFPDFSDQDYISKESLNAYRKKYLESLFKQGHREVNKLESDVIQSIHDHTLLSQDIEPEMDAKLTYGQKVADKIAEFGGSWTFIIVFFSFLLIWMAVNIWVLTSKPFDPYPFILLNLILSCLAAIQAPIIMMSQNRQEQKDRSRAEHDYKVNLKAELEIRLLHEKIDNMIIYQNKRLLDIQELQVDYLQDLAAKKKEEDGKA